MDDAGFSEQMQQLQEAALLTPKEADFRQYLVKTGVAEDIVKVLVGLEETEEKPVDAEGFVREHYSYVRALREQDRGGGPGLLAPLRGPPSSLSSSLKQFPTE